MLKKLLSLVVVVCVSCCLGVMAQPIYTHLDASDGLSDNRVTSMVELPDGRMLVTTEGCLNIYDGNKFRHFHSVNQPWVTLKKYHGHYHLYTDSERRLWIKDWQRVWCLNLNTECFVSNYDSLRRELLGEREMEDLFVDSEGRHVWVVSGDKVIDTNTQRSYPLNVSNGELLDLDVRNQRVYFFMSNGHVDVHDTEGKERCVSFPSTDAYTKTSMIVFDSATRSFLQIRTDNGKSILLKFDTRKQTWKTLLTTDYILHTIALARPGLVYITSANGLWILNTETEEVRMDTSYSVVKSSQMDLDLNTLYFDSNGGLWLGSVRQGIIYTHPARARFHSERSKEKKAYVPTTQERYKGLGIYATCMDSRKNTWYGLADGLALVSKEQDERIFHVEDGLSGNAVHSLVQDRKGRIWAGTSYGITCIDMDDNGQVTLTPYHPLDGTLEDEYMDNGATLLEDGSIELVGMGGTTVFHPDSVVLEPRPLTAELTELSIDGKQTYLWNGKALALTDTIELKHDYRNLSLVFSSYNYSLPEHTVYRYRLMQEKGDSTWTIVSQKNWGKGMLSLSYDHLKAGSYTLQVASSMGKSEMFGRVRELHIIVLPPWWESTWAYVLYGLLTLALITLVTWAVFWYREQKMKQQLREEMLLARIRTLMEVQQKESEELPQIKNEARTDGNRDFLNKAIEKVEENLMTPGYSVERLAQDLCMERTGLYKRLTQILDQTPSLFIRSIKLRHVATLLTTTDLTVTEIAERGGFSSVSHLGRLFKEEYGCKPLEYRQQKSKK
jgi:AraC-like DNA-binding protein/ligand-binding sensor domain-containing protein